MAYTLIASAKEASGGGGPTDAIDTTGADLMVVAVTGSIAPTNITDSKSNTWTALTVRSNGGSGHQRLFYCYAPTVGSGHTVSTGTDNDTFSGITVAAFSGAVTSPFDQESGTTAASGTSGAPGSITPSEDNCLVITGIGHATAEAFSSINGGFTIAQNKAGVGGVVYSCGLAYLIQTTAAAANPSWSWATSSGHEITMATFKAASGGGASAVPLLMQHYN